MVRDVRSRRGALQFSGQALDGLVQQLCTSYAGLGSLAARETKSVCFLP